MEKYKKKQYLTEYNYINDKYFDNIKTLTPLEKIKDRPAYKCEVMINDILYTLYKYKNGEILLIPKCDDLFSDDFDTIYKLSCIRTSGIFFSMLKKQNSIIENYGYNFMLNELAFKADYLTQLLCYQSIIDKDNLLYNNYKKMNVSEELFLMRHNINQIKMLRDEIFIELRKYKNNYCEKYISESFKYLFYNAIYNQIDFSELNIDSDDSLMEATYNLLTESNLQKVKRI